MPTFADQMVDTLQSLPAGRLHDEFPQAAAAQHQLLTTAVTPATATHLPSTSHRCWNCRHRWLRCYFPCVCGATIDGRDPDQHHGAQHHVGQAAPCLPGPSPAAQALDPSAPHSQDTIITSNPVQEVAASSSGRGIRAPGASAARQRLAGMSGLWRRAFGLGGGSSPKRPASGGRSSSWVRAAIPHALVRAWASLANCHTCFMAVLLHRLPSCMHCKTFAGDHVLHKIMANRYRHLLLPPCLLQVSYAAGPRAQEPRRALQTSTCPRCQRRPSSWTQLAPPLPLPAVPAAALAAVCVAVPHAARHTYPMAAAPALPVQRPE